MKGGYVNVDCTGVELTTETAQTVAGIFERVVSAFKANKPIYAYNCTWEGDLMTPVAIMVTPRSSGNYIATASTLQLEIAPDNTVTVINMLASTRTTKTTSTK